MIKGDLDARLVEIDEFVAFNNAFAAEKGIKGTSKKKIKSFGKNVLLSCAVWDNRPLVMHATVLDFEQKKGRSLLSANARFNDPEDRKLIGKANRWLHWWDMCHLFEMNFSIYDWGGIAGDSKDHDKEGIDKFKEGFGGSLVKEAHFYPFFLKAFLRS